MVGLVREGVLVGLVREGVLVGLVREGVLVGLVRKGVRVGLVWPGVRIWLVRRRVRVRPVGQRGQVRFAGQGLGIGFVPERVRAGLVGQGGGVGLLRQGGGVGLLREGGGGRLDGHGIGAGPVRRIRIPGPQGTGALRAFQAAPGARSPGARAGSRPLLQCRQYGRPGPTAGPGDLAQHPLGLIRAEPPGGNVVQQAPDDRPQRPGPARRIRIFIDHRHQRGERPGPVVGWPPLNQGVERRAERPEIRLRAAAFAAGPLGGDVRG